MAERRKLIVVGGPTASGKTSLAIALAQRYTTDIISGDSRQFYQEMRIGNARPTAEELASAPHHFVADRSLLDPLTAGRFADEAMALLEGQLSDKQVVVLVGGSGLYLRALCEGLDIFPEVTDEARSQVQNTWEEQGLPGLQITLQSLDPDYYATVDVQNPRRLQRALEVCIASGQPYSTFLGNRPSRPFDSIYLTTEVERPLLYDRINSRVDLMLASGLEDESRSLRNLRHLPALQTVGYQEWWPYFDGEYDRERAVELVKRNSRRYAKRQITWFGRGDLYTPVDSVEVAVRLVDNVLKGEGF